MNEEPRCHICGEPGTTLKRLSSVEGKVWAHEHDAPASCIRALCYRIDALNKERIYWYGRYREECIAHEETLTEKERRD